MELGWATGQAYGRTGVQAYGDREEQPPEQGPVSGAVQGELWSAAPAGGGGPAPASDRAPPLPPPEGIRRLDFFLSEPDTTNNRMALRSALAALELLAPVGASRIRFVTDSNYIVLGMTKWVPAWRARGWRRKGGAIENLDLWQELVARAADRRIAWSWVRGHAGHPKNEYANHVATRAAAEQGASRGLVASGFPAWLEGERARGRYRRFDPDGDLR